MVSGAQIQKDVANYIEHDTSLIGDYEGEKEGDDNDDENKEKDNGFEITEKERHDFILSHM